MTIAPLGKYGTGSDAQGRVDYLLGQVVPTQADYYLNGAAQGAPSPVRKRFMKTGLSGMSKSVAERETSGDWHAAVHSATTRFALTIPIAWRYTVRRSRNGSARC